jgi:hypothetical protein
MDNLPPSTTITLPINTTWKSAIDAVGSSLEDNGAILLWQPMKPRIKRRLREIALGQARHENTASSSPPVGGGLRIQTNVDVKAIGPPKPSAENVRKILKENAKSMQQFPDPYPLKLVPNIDEMTLALVPCSLKIEGFDSDPGDPTVTFAEIDGLWDTGAHSSVIVEDLLPGNFLQYLKDPKHDPYRSSSGSLRVQVSATLGFSNGAIQIEAIFVVVPRTAVPHERIGILLGQKTLIDRIVHLTTPIAVLLAKGFEMPDEVWGHIDVYEYVNIEDEVIKS